MAKKIGPIPVEIEFTNHKSKLIIGCFDDDTEMPIRVNGETYFVTREDMIRIRLFIGRNIRATAD